MDAKISEIILRSKNLVKSKMFQVLDNKTTKKVIEGKIDYNDVPVEDSDNEIAKGYFFKDQADFIEKFGDDKPMCLATRSPCLKKRCQLYADVGHSRPLCREYKLYFENALLTYVGEKFTDVLLKAQAR